MYILILLILGSSAFILALLFTPLFRRIAVRWDLVDRPDFQRKIHTKPVPRIGGFPILLAYAGSYLLLTLSPGLNGLSAAVSLSRAWSLAPAVFVVFLVGLADDLFGLKPWQKLAGELVASGLAVFSGVRIAGIDGVFFHPWIAALGTLVWLIGCTNAFNLIDGVDGLASGVALLAAVTIAVAALFSGDTGLALATVPLACALLGFLRYNSNPASIFLGDCGSLTVGFLLGCYGVMWCEKSATILGMTAPLIALAVPLLDTAVAIARRFLRREPIFGADRAHVHHRLLARGFSPRRVAVVLYAAAGCAGILSLLMSRYHDRWGGAIVVLFAVGAILGIRRLGYAEFGMASRIFLAGTFRRLLKNQLSLDACEQRLVAAGTPGECWSAIESASRNFGFYRVELQVAGHTYSYQDAIRSSAFWEIRVPISDRDFLTMRHSFDGSSQTSVVEPFVDTLRRTLGGKVVVFDQGDSSVPTPAAFSALAARNGN